MSTKFHKILFHIRQHLLITSITSKKTFNIYITNLIIFKINLQNYFHAADYFMTFCEINLKKQLNFEEIFINVETTIFCRT